MKGAQWIDIRSDRQKVLSYVKLGKKYHMDPRMAKRYTELPERPEYTLSEPKPTKMDPFTPVVDKWLEEAPYSVKRILEKLREIGFDGGYSIVKAYVSSRKMDLNEKATLFNSTRKFSRGKSRNWFGAVWRKLERSGKSSGRNGASTRRPRLPIDLLMNYNKTRYFVKLMGVFRRALAFPGVCPLGPLRAGLTGPMCASGLYCAHCQRRCDFVVFRRTGNVEKWRVRVYSLCIIILAVFVRQA